MTCIGLASGVRAAEVPAAAPRWVHGSSVNVRAGAARDAKVLANWTTNTKLDLLKQEGEWCLLRAQDGVTGYVHCSLIGAKPLTLADLGAELGDPGKSDLAARAFWIAPSFRRFEQYGMWLDYSVLTQEQREREEKTQKPIRFAVPEFDAMKRRLKEGILPDFSLAVPRVQAFGADLPKERAWWMGETLTYLKGFLTPEMLRDAKPSLFAKQSDVLIFGEFFASADGIAAQFDRPSTASPMGAPRYQAGHHDAGIAGIWDIGSIEVRYPAATVLHAVSRNGLVGARQIATASLVGRSYGDGCTEGYSPLPDGKPLAGYPKVNERLVAFYGPKPIEARKVQIMTRKARAYIHTDPNSGPPKPEWRDLLVHHIDLNNDNAPDIAVLEARLPRAGFDPVQMASWFFYFVNIAGTWWVAGFEQYGECT